MSLKALDRLRNVVWWLSDLPLKWHEQVCDFTHPHGPMVTHRYNDERDTVDFGRYCPTCRTWIVMTVNNTGERSSFYRCAFWQHADQNHRELVAS